MSNRTLKAIALGLIAALVPAVAHADDAASPPRLVGFIDATYPAQALAERRGARVELLVTVGADGAVTDVEVVTPAGNGFDEAAVEAVRRFTFEPATSGGNKIAARIRYAYVFEPPPVPTPAPAPVVEPRGRIEGRVLDRAYSEPIAGADVRVERPDGSIVASGVTDEHGAFAFDAIAVGSYRVRVSAFELAAFVADETIAEGTATSVTYRLDGKPHVEVSGEFGATAVIEAPAREVTTRKLRATELTKVAGTRGDALRSVELLPGVARPDAGQGMMIVRGSSPWDSGVFLDGADILMLYHFGGLTSFVPSTLLHSIDFHPGNFSTKYGRRIGGVIEATLRDPRTDRVHGVADVNLLDTSLQLEGPLAKNLSFMVAARRSYIDAWFESVVPADEIGVTSAPVYWDWQAMIQWNPTARDRVRLTGYGSNDTMELVAKQVDDRSPMMRGRVAGEIGFQRGALAWKHRYSPTLEHEVSVASGPFVMNFDLGPGLSQRIGARGLYGRAEWRARLAPRVRLTSGIDLSHEWGQWSFEGPAQMQSEGNPDMDNFLDSEQRARFDEYVRFTRPAAYVETSVHATRDLELIGGMRADYFGEIGQATVDPRVVARQSIGDEVVVKAGVGRFSQPPAYGEAIRGFGNPDLDAISAIHTSAGVEYRPYERSTFALDGFYKKLDHLVVGGDAGLENGGIGRIYGLEGAARLAPGGRLSGFLSYTLSRSERNDHGMGWRLFDFDQTHILNASGMVTLGAGWTLGSTLRLTSGSPETPVVDRVYDANSDVYRPIYGDVNSDRKPLFHQLDLRVEKKWQRGWGNVTAYLDVQNAYNARHVEGRVWNYDYTRSVLAYGLPVLPSLGLRGEL